VGATGYKFQVKDDRFSFIIVLLIFSSSRDLGYNQQALYCYRKLYSLDPTNVDALWDRASLAKEMGDLRTVKPSLLSGLHQLKRTLRLAIHILPFSNVFRTTSPSLKSSDLF
jgi:hypothetical protein